MRQILRVMTLPAELPENFDLIDHTWDDTAEPEPADMDTGANEGIKSM